MIYFHLVVNFRVRNPKIQILLCSITPGWSVKKKLITFFEDPILSKFVTKFDGQSLKEH